MAIVSVDYSHPLGKIKPVHGVGQPPFSGMDFSMVSYLKEAHIPFSRLHDVGAVYGGTRFVDIPILFPDFDADPADPASYDFAFTDVLMAALVENGVEPFFRLGVTIENYATVKSYNIHPPKDNLKWAKICEGVIRHYTEGWADGYYYTIRYWEIWNEPDNYEDPKKNQMWTGSKEQYYDLYVTAANYLKEKFPYLKIGGFASCGFYAIDNKQVGSANSSPRLNWFITFFDGFLDYLKEHPAPLDFFSWHSYGDIPSTMNYAAYARKRLDDAGYTKTETTCNEWNNMVQLRGTLKHAAQNTGMLLAMQDSCLDSAMFYDARLELSVYGSLFHPMEKRPYPTYYGFKAFGELYAMGTQLSVKVDREELYAVAATDGTKAGILIVNTGKEMPLQLDLQGRNITACRSIDEAHNLEDCALPITLGENHILYLETEI